MKNIIIILLIFIILLMRWIYKEIIFTCATKAELYDNYILWKTLKNN